MTANTKKSDKENTSTASKDEVTIAFDKLQEAQKHFEQAAQAAGVEVKQEASEQFLKGKAKQQEMVRQAASFAREKPLTTLGIAFASGFVLSQLFSRK